MVQQLCRFEDGKCVRCGRTCPACTGCLWTEETAGAPQPCPCTECDDPVEFNWADEPFCPEITPQKLHFLTQKSDIYWPNDIKHFLAPCQAITPYVTVNVEDVTCITCRAWLLRVVQAVNSSSWRKS